MKPGLGVGTEFVHVYVVPRTKTVRNIFREAEEFADFPEILATGFMVALMEWACTRALQPYLETGEGSLGIRICVSHDAPTPPGLTVTVRARVVSIDGKRLTWHVVAHDGIDEIGRGSHTRALIDLDRFNRRLRKKIATMK